MPSLEQNQMLVEQLGKALKQWHQDNTDTSLHEYLPSLVKQVASTTPNGFATDYHQNVNKLLFRLLETLADADNTSSALLRRLYIDDEKGFVVANSMGISESALYRQRRDALQALARTASIEEKKAQLDRKAILEARIELPAMQPLVGVTSYMEHLRKVVTPFSEIRLVCLAGIGGIGKTSLAVSIIRELIGNGIFDEVAWISARPQEFGSWGEIRQTYESDFNTEELLTLLHRQLSDKEETFQTTNEMLSDLRAQFSQTPHLIVVDNLETADDHRKLIPLLIELSQYAWVLLTSRIGVIDYPEIHTILLRELSRSNVDVFIREEANRRGILELADANPEVIENIYATVGGNPLALKLVIGQIQVRSLPTVLTDLTEARGQQAESFYEFIYRKAWDSLDNIARRVLLTMPLVAKPGADLDHLAGITDLVQDELYDALDLLIRLSLIEVGGTLELRRYHIHRLTETFLHKQVTKWYQQ